MQSRASPTNLSKALCMEESKQWLNVTHLKCVKWRWQLTNSLIWSGCILPFLLMEKKVVLTCKLDLPKKSLLKLQLTKVLHLIWPRRPSFALVTALKPKMDGKVVSERSLLSPSFLLVMKLTLSWFIQSIHTHFSLLDTTDLLETQMKSLLLERLIKPVCLNLTKIGNNKPWDMKKVKMILSSENKEEQLTFALLLHSLRTYPTLLNWLHHLRCKLTRALKRQIFLILHHSHLKWTEIPVSLQLFKKPKILAI